MPFFPCKSHASKDLPAGSQLQGRESFESRDPQPHGWEILAKTKTGSHGWNGMLGTVHGPQGRGLPDWNELQRYIGTTIFVQTSVFSLVKYVPYIKIIFSALQKPWFFIYWFHKYLYAGFMRKLAIGTLCSVPNPLYALIPESCVVLPALSIGMKSVDLICYEHSSYSTFSSIAHLGMS